MITGKAGCNRGSFYYHFDDKFDLADSLIDADLRQLQPGLAIARKIVRLLRTKANGTYNEDGGTCTVSPSLMGHVREKRG